MSKNPSFCSPRHARYQMLACQRAYPLRCSKLWQAMSIGHGFAFAVEMLCQGTHHRSHLGVFWFNIGSHPYLLESSRTDWSDRRHTRLVVQGLNQFQRLSRRTSDLNKVADLNLAGEGDRLHATADQILNQVLELKQIFGQQPLVQQHVLNVCSSRLECFRKRGIPFAIVEHCN